MQCMFLCLFWRFKAFCRSCCSRAVFIQMLVKFKGILNYVKLGSSVGLFSNPHEHGGNNNGIGNVKYTYIKLLWLEKTLKGLLLLLIKKNIPQSRAVLIFWVNMLLTWLLYHFWIAEYYFLNNSQDVLECVHK